MAIGKNLLVWTALTVPALLGACNSGSQGGPTNAVVGASQDLGVDPTGHTTRFTFQKAAPVSAGPGNFQASGGQLALGVMFSGNDALVLWDDRVTPSHQVQVVGIPDVGAAPTSVTTTDPAPPTFTIPVAIQNAGLGGDQILVQFSGANLVESVAEDPSNWTLQIDGVSLNLAGSSITYSAGSQMLGITTGLGANLHASFQLAATNLVSVADVPLSGAPVAGTATGDTDPPALLSVLQNLTEDPFGYVVDLTFDEAMDPVFATQLANFDAGFPVLAANVAQPAANVLRVTFTNPMVPGLDSITLSNVVDAHGNDLTGAAGPQGVVAGSTVANGFTVDPVLDTVPDAGGDTIVLEFDQPLDPDTAEEFARWSVESPTGNPLDLSGATLSYDHPSATLTITLAEDVQTADSFQVGPGATAPVDVDGEDFVTVFAGTVTGDVTPPAAASSVQDRTLDPTGLTYDVVLDEDVDSVAAETPGNWSVTGGATVLTATQLSGDRVRLVLDDLAVPGQDTFTVANLMDLAGNVMAAPQAGILITSTDVTSPTASSPMAFAHEGADDDTVSVVFDDDMVQSEVEDPANWMVESPAGTPLDTTLASVSYDPVLRKAELTFDGGDQIDLKHFDDFVVQVQNMSDISGNSVVASPLSGDVDGETNFPTVETAWVEAGDPSRLHVMFDEPMDHLDDLAGPTAYTVRDAGMLVVGSPASVVVDADRMGATLLLGFGVVAGTHTVDVSGVTDLAGNAMFPVDLVPVVAEDPAAPALDAGMSTLTSVSGEDNDVITVEFDRPMSSWGIDDPAGFDVSDGTSVDLTSATFDFDGAQTLTISLDAPVSDPLQTGVAYTLTVDGLRSRQGIAMAGPSAEPVVAAGDGTPAAQSAARTRIDTQFPTSSVLVEFDEAVDIDQADDVTNYTKGGIDADLALRMDYRTVRVTWLAGVAVGQQIDVTMDDLAGNPGVTNQLVVAAPTAGPVVVSAGGTATEGIGGDFVSITFNMPVNLNDAVNKSNYSIDQGGVPVNIVNAVVTGDSASNTVRLHLVPGVELDPSQQIHVTVDNVRNADGITINPPADLNGSVTGDTTPPGFVSSFVNYRGDAGGLAVDVWLTEDCHPTFLTTPSNFTASGGQTVLSAVRLRSDVVRLNLTAPLSGGDTIDTNLLPDPAGNVSGPISTTPLL